jgi:uncharacterized membrane protein HdeD (DUF308 family)
MTDDSPKKFSLKLKRFLWVTAGIFFLPFLIFINTEHIKYVFLGVAMICTGILFRINDIEDPVSPDLRRLFASGTYAWIAFILIGIYLIVLCSYQIATTGIW